MAQHFTSSQEVAVWMRAHVKGTLTSDSRLVKTGDGFHLVIAVSGGDSKAVVEDGAGADFVLGRLACILNRYGGAIDSLLAVWGVVHLEKEL